MQDPTQPTLPVNPQVMASTGQSTPPSQVVADLTQAGVDPTQTVDPPTPTPQPSIPPASDPQLIASSPTQPTDAEASPDQNPLDILESILAEAKQKASQNAPTGEGADGSDRASIPTTDPNDPTASPPQPPPSPEEIAAKEATHQAEIEQQKQQLMAQITQTPEYQARVEQEAEKAEEQSKSVAGGDGFQIQQLQHTKIWNTQHVLSP